MHISNKVLPAGVFPKLHKNGKVLNDLIRSPKIRKELENLQNVTGKHQNISSNKLEILFSAPLKLSGKASSL